jgi:hypothetical protein
MYVYVRPNECLSVPRDTELYSAVELREKKHIVSQSVVN